MLMIPYVFSNGIQITQNDIPFIRGINPVLVPDITQALSLQIRTHFDHLNDEYNIY